MEVEADHDTVAGGRVAKRAIELLATQAPRAVIKEFLVEIRLEGTDAIPEDKLVELRRAEAARASELAAQGVLVRLWRTHEPGWRNVGLWRASSEQELRSAISSLPLASYMVVSLRPLKGHPNDPDGERRRASNTLAARRPCEVV